MKCGEIKNAYCDIMGEHKVPVAWHSFIQIPTSHCFGTYNIPQSVFDGADEYAMYKEETIELSLFYRGSKTESDFGIEEELEQALRPCGQFLKKTGYDSNNELFYSTYVIECHEFLD